jgi:hypothetical protein
MRPQSTHRVAMATFCVHSIIMVKSAQPGEGGGMVHAFPLSLYLPSRAKLWCTLQLRGQIRTLPLFLFFPYMLCTVLCGRYLLYRRDTMDRSFSNFLYSKTPAFSILWFCPAFCCFVNLSRVLLCCDFVPRFCYYAICPLQPTSIKHLPFRWMEGGGGEEIEKVIAIVAESAGGWGGGGGGRNAVKRGLKKIVGKNPL